MRKKICLTAAIIAVMLVVTAGLTGCFFGGAEATYTISFYTDATLYHTITVTSETTQISLPPQPNKVGFVFDNWYYDKGVWDRPFTDESIAGGLKKSIKLYAKFDVDPQTLMHTVSYKVDGAAVHTKEVSEGDAIPSYTPTKEGYTFLHWLYEGGTPPAVMGDGDIDLDAVFAANSYKIYFVMSEGENLAGSYQTDSGGKYINVVYDSPYAAMFNAVSATSAGKTFAYWLRDGSEFAVGQAYKTAGNISLNPVWADEGTAGLQFVYVAGTDSYEVATDTIAASEIVIPASYNGSEGLKPVSGIRYIKAANATSIKIQNPVSVIKQSAFVHCSNLNTVIIASSVAVVQADVFPPDSGINIYCKLESKPSGFVADWDCNNNIIWDNEVYAAKAFDLANPQSVSADILFEVAEAYVSSDGVLFDLIDSDNYIADNANLTIKASYLSTLTKGSYTFKLNGIVSASFSLQIYDDMFNIRYDKAGGGDVVRAFAGVSVQKVGGGGIMQADYSVAGGVLTIEQSYFDALKGGSYKLLVQGSGGFAEVLTVTILDTAGKPYNVKLDCDINMPSYTILFDCDYDQPTAYSYRIDGGAYLQCESGDTVAALANTVSHTLEVRCDATGETDLYTLPAMSSAESYLTQTFTWDGTEYNKYIADQSELNVYMAYLVHSGCEQGVLQVSPSKPYGYVEGVVYIGGFAYSLDAANRSFDFPWGFSSQISSLGNIATFTINYRTTPKAQYSTGQAQAFVTDNRGLAEGSRASNYESFAINSHTKTEVIGSVQELDSLTYGTKPSFAGGSAEAQSIYNLASNVCRTYISDSMTDYQKATAIYEWLAINITYGSDALQLIELQNDIEEGVTTLAAAQARIDTATASNPHWTILTPVRSKGTLAELRAELDNVIKGLKVFHLQGVFIDKIAVCDGIASAFKLMCLIEGIECIEVVGDAGEAHAWNKVRIDGEWLVVDATWSRKKYSNIDNIEVTHEWLLITDLAASKSRAEQNKNGADRIEVLADGEYSYYQSYTVGGGYDLIADSQAELDAIFAYHIAQGNNTVEFLYNISGVSTYSKSHGGYIYSWNFTEKKVYLVDISNLIIGG